MQPVKILCSSSLDLCKRGCYMVVCVVWHSGVEPWSYYFVNCFLNFNVVFVMAVVSLPMVVSRDIYFLFI